MSNYVFKDKDGNALPMQNYTASAEAVQNAILTLVNNGKIVLPGVSRDDVINAVKQLSPLYNMKWTQIGDSNTQYMGQELGDYVIEHHHIKSYTNLGTAGQTWETANGINTKDNSAVGRVNQLIANADVDTKLCTDYDIVTVMMGTNCNVVGTINDAPTQVETMCGATKYCLQKLCYYYRKSKIGVIIPTQRAEANAEQKQRNELIKTICADYSVPVLDMYSEGRILPDNKLNNQASYYLSDGLHFGGSGKLHYYRRVGAWLETI